MEIRPHLIGIAGPSASGKTFLARALRQHLDASVIRCDDYYRDHAHLELEARALVNYDHPDSIEYELIVQHVATIREGGAIDVPSYDFVTHARLEPTRRVDPAPYVFIDGIHVLHVDPLRTACDLRIYVHAEHETCLERRIARDVAERGRTQESVVWQYERSVRPMCDEFVIPSRNHADVVVDGTEPIEDGVKAVLDALGV
ncbi:MAG: uridine kinase [Planctomycetota bacterium]